MAETTLEEARRCPFCQQPGKEVASSNLPDRSVAHTFQCENQRCSDCGGRRIVQTLPDGSVPQPNIGPKSFPKLNLNSNAAQRARDELRLLDFMSTHPELTRAEAIRAIGG
jgi:hypothetical protein